MENAERKRREVLNKNYVSKLRKKPRKSIKKKTKGKENFNSLINGHKCDRLGVDGMFCKGLRTHYITGETLSEVNEARKKEDINKIIDIGRVFLQKGELPVPPGRTGKRITSRSDNRKPQKSFTRFDGSSADSDHDSDCTLSSIRGRSFERLESSPRWQQTVERVAVSTIYAPNSLATNLRIFRPPFAGTTEENGATPMVTPSQGHGARRKPARRKKLDLEKELRSFSLKYETAVDAHILSKLPGNGVLEDALTALRKLQKAKAHEELDREKTSCSNDVAFLRNDVEVEDYVMSSSFLVAEERFCERFMQTPLENVFVMGGTEVENANHPLHLTLFDNGDETENASVIEFQAKGFQKPMKEFSIATPPIQFYRRNMF